MEINKTKSEKDSNLDNRSRRKVLETIGAGGMASVVLGGGLGSVAATSNWPGVVLAKYRGLETGLSNDEIVGIQNQTLEEYRSRTGDDDLKVVGSPDVWSEQMKTNVSVVSYALKMYPDGTSEYHAGLVEAGQPDDMVLEAHNETRSFVQNITDQRQAEAVASMASSQNSDDANYEYVAGGSDSNPGCPEGTISISSDVYEWVKEDSDRTIFSTQADFQAIPGTNRSECNNNAWYNGKTKECTHQWDRSDLTGGEQMDHKPSGGSNGSKSTNFTLSTQGASISWSYDQPNVDRDDNSDLSEAKWFYDYNSTEAESQTCVWESGSEAEFDKNQDPDRGDKLYNGYFNHKFFDKLNYGRKTKDIAYQYNYGYG
jgi:hypothetical protein